ncbi:MAG: radical SAM protein [Thermoplasmata archaeon]
MRTSEVTCRSALVPSRLPALDYALNPYRGCAFGCVYCYSPAVLREARPWGGFVDVRRNIPYVLAKELRSCPRGIVGIGTVTDAYQPLEAKYELTRFCLEQLLRYDFPVSIQTKSHLILRDLEIVREFSQLDVGFSFSTLNESLRRVFEPRAPPTESRIFALERVTSSGVNTWAFLGPIIPGVSEADMDELLRKIAATGTKLLIADKLRARPAVWDNLRAAMNDHPVLEYMHRKALWEDSLYFERILQRVRDRCHQLGLVYREAFPRRGQEKRVSGSQSEATPNTAGLASWSGFSERVTRI